MSNQEFENLINQTVIACNKHKDLLEKAEKEYVRRFGNHPSDIDDDYWIDLLNYGNGSVNLAKIIENAKLLKKR